MALIVVATGGGIKGAVAAARYAPEHEIIFLHVDYGQRSAPLERDAVQAILASFQNARLVTLELPHVRQLAEQLSREAETPQFGRRAASDRRDSPAPVTLLGLMPVLLSTALQGAIQAGSSRVITGLSGMVDASHLGLPLPGGQFGQQLDYVHAFNVMLEALSAQRWTVRVEAPLMEMSYPEIVKLALHFRIPLEHTRTCPGAGRRPCERCEACKARAAAFEEARIADPLIPAVPT